MSATIRTRFAPSPTGFMHIGNLRSALYEYLIAKSQKGEFILRIEDTDQERYVEGALDAIYTTLKAVGLSHDEGPDLGGPYAPYTQSERLEQYKHFAENLVTQGHAYRCFCSKERLEALHQKDAFAGYDRHCRHLNPNEIENLLAANTPFVIRQKMPLTGKTEFHDQVFGAIVVDNTELEDQILLKSDGYPTYNFANVIDDHAMHITHVVRGAEYLSSTPKYNLLYDAFAWEKPTYVHLPLINGTDGKKLSKRHGATSFDDLIEEGYLAAAIINYIAFLGWSPGEDTREIFSLAELSEIFSIKGISKSPAVFDYEKLKWFNAEYIKKIDPTDFQLLLAEKLPKEIKDKVFDFQILAEIIQSRLIKFSDLTELLAFVLAPKDYDLELFQHKKSKLTPEIAKQVIPVVLAKLETLPHFDRTQIHDYLMNLGPELGLKTGQIMGPLRIALSGQSVTPGGSIELLMILGKAESMMRLQAAIEKLAN